MNDYMAWGAQDLSSTNHLKKPAIKDLPVRSNMVLEDVESGWVGAAVRLERVGGAHMVALEDERGKIKMFPLGFGFLFEGKPVKLVLPVTQKKPQKLVSRSGSYAVQNQTTKVALPSRLWVEGVHDAELVEKVWGHDLRVEGIVVEPLHGVDDLAAAIRAFDPNPHRKLGILVDHLVTGTKEERIVREARSVPGAEHSVKIVGHPFVDVWQAIKPSALGISQWPVIPRSEEWKKGVLKRFGWAYETQDDVAQGWQRILSRVDSYSQLEPSLLGPVESLIDFLTEE